MKIQLNVLERLRIVNDILPPQGNIITLRMVRSLVDRLGLSAGEIAAFEVIQDEKGRVTWNERGNVLQEFEFATAEIELIKNQLKALDTASKLTDDMITIYDKFC